MAPGGLFDYDAEVAPHNRRFREVAAVGAQDRVLDVGCGTGQSTREAARAAAAGSVLGVDLSAPALEQARRLTEDEGLGNVAYLRADAAAHEFAQAHFDLCLSRFGTMFFPDPVAAFTNLAHALRPAARLVLLVWQDRERNEWATAVDEAITRTPPPPRPGEDPFALADPATTERILTTAGFTDVAFTDVHEPVYYGPDAAVAYDMVLSLRRPQQLLAHADAGDEARRRLRALLGARERGEGVYFDSRAWLVTAERRAARVR
ncbi:class I SAM-dependent methyltransferase [Amycolatopsis alkalitolerans]|uniref:Class I SAM-dependent methyltransferase n=1 Tax=Amycolatopsis alkalitolerans TaxID=2547244 RepID=A0A5C4M6A1_9PSEU|nr:class I SAM-dependent methyltransferase [Amycolatopsis alkalitolerans]TNC28672.1 class I SAM-dependent methyltransferase [Amycolatopsis alkalitolerans]